MANHREKFGLTPDATEKQVKAEWSKVAKRVHPDYGGTSEEFQVARSLYLSALAESQDPIRCKSCGGSGYVRELQGWTSINIRCGRCKGSGKLH